MKKKGLILSTGLIIILLLLLGISSASASAPQSPSKPAAQWEKEGYQVIDLAETAYAQDTEGFIVLRKDINFLKAESNGFSAGENTLTCSGYTSLQTGSGEFASTYCVLAGGKFYFGEREGAASDGSTVALKNVSAVDSMNQASYMAMTVYTLGAWIDHTFDIDYKTKDPTEPPIVVHGSIKFFLDHWSVDPGVTEATEHTLRIYMDADMDTMSLESDTVVTDAGIDVGILSWEHITVVAAELSLEDFTGKINFALKSHYGETITWKSYYLKLYDFNLAYDDDNGTNCDMNEMNVKGNFRYELAFGPQATADFIVFSVTLGWTLDFGIIMVPTDPPAQFSPPDTKVNWHVCNDCLHSNICPVIGPAVLTLKFHNPVIDIDKRWPSDEIILDPFYDFYYSNTFADYGEGTCPHYGYRLDATVHNQDGKPLKDAAVSYEPVPAHYNPEASASTDSAGKATLYPPADTVLVQAKLTSTSEPGQTLTREKKVIIAKELNRVDFEFDIPVKHVYFRNSQTGEAAGWPEDIEFTPFFSETVALPDTVPTLSGRVFAGWNTEEDGSGTNYSPGTKLTLKHDQTLWAQWSMAGDNWYVIYSANGGTEAPKPQKIRKGMDARLSKELPKAGTMIFKGWTPNLHTMDPLYQPGDTLPYDSSKNTVILYAVWNLSPVPKPISITFDANGLRGAEIPPDIWFEENVWYQLPHAVAPIGGEYAFGGWSENPSSSDPEFLPGQTYFFYRSVKLYAVWIRLKTMMLTFRDSLPDAASGIPDPIVIRSSMSRNVRIPNQIPKKSGRMFIGWNTMQDGSGKKYTPGSVITLMGDTDLWAQWDTAGNSWYVIYNANGGTSAPGPQIIPRGQDAILSKGQPGSITMHFIGWATDPDAKVPEYQPGELLPYVHGRNYVVLYALWEMHPPKQPVIISFHANGGRPDTVPPQITVPVWTWIRVPEQTPFWDGWHKFLGWSDNPLAKTPRWKPGDTVQFGKDTVLYAIWEARKLPPTGDTGNPALWLTLVLLGIVGISLSAWLPRVTRRKKKSP